MQHQKRVFVIVALVAALMAHFWLGSRYPAIDEKAAMAGEVVMGDVLSFDAHFPVEADDPIWMKIGLSTANWTLTNRQGMTFGVLLATLILTLLRYWRPQPGSGNPFVDALKGVIIGTPLGVCVNCAAPIAYGMRKQGLSAGASLATMFASPTLNIVVLAMTFSLLPLYMGVTKVVVTLAFIVVVLPVLVRLAGAEPPQLTLPVPAPDDDGTARETWRQAIAGLVPDLWRSFRFIFIRTVPLMLLAGLLGAAMAHLVRLDSLAAWEVTAAAMAGVALVGTFAPVPIAFDVVIVQALYMAGLPAPFAMVLLLTLGLFSVYPFLIVVRLQSWRFATQLFVAVAVLGFVTGYGSLAYEEHSAKAEARMFAERFEGRAGPPDPEPAADAPTGTPATGTATAAPVNPPTAASGSDHAAVSWSREAFASAAGTGEKAFVRHDGRDFGLETAAPQVMDFMLPYSQGRGIAAADFDRDGFVDLALANNDGIALYRNNGGESFTRLPLDENPLDRLSVLLVAFADFTNDGCPDLFVGATGDDDYILANDCDAFAGGRVIAVPHLGSFLTQAAAFADIDRDGYLDILRGNWFFLIPRVAPSERDRNHLLLNRGGYRFEQQILEEIHGETLSVLLSDLDQDGIADLVVGNDYQEPDLYYRGGPDAVFVPLEPSAIPVSTNATMSIDAADFDNDGDLDIFLSGKVSDFDLRRGLDEPASSLAERRTLVLKHRADFQQRYCNLYDSETEQDACRRRFVFGDAFRRSTLAACERLDGARAQDECMITIRIKNALVRRDWSFCPQIPATEFPVHRAICDAYAGYDLEARPDDPRNMYLDQGAIPQKGQGNVLLVRQPDGRYADRSADLGVDNAVWAWNARFADLDLDGWQDLFVVNGWWLETTMYSNRFFHNRAGRGFEAREVEFGLHSLIKQHAAVIFDLDNDGDPDVLTRSLDGHLDIFVNTLTDRNPIAFELRDELGNRAAIGSRVTIEHEGADAGTRMTQIREVKLGGGFLSFDPPEARFGLGAVEAVSRVTITWPDGATTHIEQPLRAGYRYTVVRREARPELAGGAN